ncbi:MAG: beta-phosphoglucomutase family hydrolase [Proteobacteria bacterium]|nr:beta-phosphoglucomutase family hydrolase [Pseudomonadota bacterium]
MPLEACIFDLDGVVVDTVPLHFQAWKRMFNEYGHEFTFDDYKRKVDGIPRYDGARAILTGLSEKDLRTAADKKQLYFRELLDAAEIPVYDTTIALIDSLISAGIKVAVISSSRNCPHILKRIGLYDRLGAVISGDDIAKGKPDPEIFLAAAERLGASPENCIAFEDAVLGVEAAKNGKMKCVGIDRYDNPGRLAMADAVIADAGETSVERLRELMP